MNVWTGIGNLTNDPELRRTSNEQDVCTFTLAVSRHKNNKKYKTDYFRIVTWRELAANCYNFLVKGSKVAVTGPIYITSYDKKDGSKGFSAEIWANSIDFLNSKGMNPNGEFSPDVMPVGANAQGSMSGWSNPAGDNGSLSGMIPVDGEDDFPF